jgi:lysophospholipase L1-like esterase
MKKTIFVFGDSNSWGWNPSNDLVSLLKRWDDDERWPGILQKELGDKYRVVVDGLNGRTTVWNDPIEEYRCGKDQIIPALDAQAPIDLLIIFVGTNDLKARYTVTAQDIANSAGLLVLKAKNQVGAFAEGKPNILLVCPPPIGPLEGGILENMFAGGVEKSKELSKYFEGVAKAFGVGYFDAGAVVKSSKIDGLHLDKDQHELLGKAISKTVKQLV